MEEIRNLLINYQDIDVDREISTFEKLAKFSAQFYRDVSEIYDAVTRIRNKGRNPTGFDFNDAAILGLLIRIWKILKEIVHYYEINNGDIISLLDRQLVEAAVVAKYLLLSDASVIEDYRKCSYKDRLRILNDAETSPDFFRSPSGVRLLNSVKEKIEKEGFSPDSLEAQKKNRWKLQGKTFFDIFSEVEPKELYKLLYGIPSESIHGSWNESMDFNLSRNEDGTFSAYPFYQEVDIRFVTPLLRLCHDPYLLWLDRVDAKHEYIGRVFEWIRRMNTRLFDAFEDVYAKRTG
jgi:hypothetical protein